MGTWGQAPFENDAAGDWDLGFKGADRDAGLVLVHAALSAAANTPEDEELDSYPGMEAVAAAELVAAIRGLDVDRAGDSELAFDWITSTRPALGRESVRLAVRALERVTATRSELAALWAEEGVDSWRESIASRIQSLRNEIAAA